MFVEKFFILYSTSKKYMNEEIVGGLLGVKRTNGILISKAPGIHLEEYRKHWTDLKLVLFNFSSLLQSKGKKNVLICITVRTILFFTSKLS